MVKKLNLTFKKVVFFSVISVLLGVSLVYVLGLAVKLQTGSPSTASPTGVPPSGFQLLIFAYNGDNQSVSSSGFVQASVTVTGPENYSGTTTTDPQNPLRFLVEPGEYFVFGTYSSAVPQNATVGVNSRSLYIYDVFLNFGSSAVPPFGHIIVTAWNITKLSGGEFLSHAVEASVTVTGPENYSGTTTTDLRYPLIFTVAPGEYTVFGTYGSFPTQNQIVDVSKGSSKGVDLFFEDAPFPPPP
jgi:hypothetical protein